MTIDRAVSAGVVWLADGRAAAVLVGLDHVRGRHARVHHRHIVVGVTRCVARCFARLSYGVMELKCVVET